LKNNTPDARHTFLVRYADVDADGSSLKNFDVNDDSAFGCDSYGLTVENLGTTNIRHSGVVSGDFRPPDPCGTFSGTGGLHQLNVDGSIRNAYDTPPPKGGALTVTLGLRGNVEQFSHSSP
jgi:hypothetical protein